MGDLKIFIRDIESLIESGDAEVQSDEFWNETGSRVLEIIDSLIESDKVNFTTTKDYEKDHLTILEILFDTLIYVPDLNRPFTYHREDNMISYYELAYSRCCAYICQLLPDRFPYIQKLLIKFLFSQHHPCSLLASDVYVLVMRIVHPNQRMAMCQIIMNLCRIAPPDALVKGAALIRRVKHPVVNFENPRYGNVLDLSQTR